MKHFLSLFILLTPLLFPTLIYAEIAWPGGGEGESVDIRQELKSLYPRYPDLEAGGGKALGLIVSRSVQAAIVLSGIAVMLYLILGGYKWLMAGGDKSKVEEARNQLTNAIIGMAIIASVWVIYGLVDNFFGIGNISNSGSSGSGSIAQDCTGSGGCSCNGHLCFGYCYPNGVCAQ